MPGPAGLLGRAPRQPGADPAGSRDGAGPAARGTARRPLRWLEVGLLLAAPLLVALAWRPALMAPAPMIDPHFYTAFLEQGRGLVERYGTGNYFWVRVGFLLPARASYELFGAVPGFLVLRYVLALVAAVPGYLLLRRLHGPAAGALAVVGLLGSPVLLYAWGSDYPDAAAVSYLAAGWALLGLAATAPEARRARRGWLTAAGVAFTLAVHSQLVALAVVAAAVAAYLWVSHGRSWRPAAGDAALLLAVGIWGTVLLAGLALAVLGSADILTPTLRAVAMLQVGPDAGRWHSATWRWVQDEPYLLVPPLLLAAWFLARRRPTGQGTGRAGAPVPAGEAVVVLGAALQLVLATALQLAAKTPMLEYHYYLSQLWPATALVLAFLLTRLTRLSAPGPGPDARAQWPRWLAAGLVLAVPWAFVAPGLRWRFHLVPVGVVLAALGLGAVGLALRTRGGGRVAGVAALLAAAYALTVGGPVGEPYLPGQAPFPRPDYARVVAGGGGHRVDRYRVVSQLPAAVSPAVGPRETVLVWLTDEDDRTLQAAAAQYLWPANGLRAPAPRLTDKSMEQLDKRRPSVVLLLGRSGDRVAASVAALRAQGVAARPVQEVTLRSGTQTLQVTVLRLTG